MFRGQEKPVKEITSPHPNPILLLFLQDPYATLSPEARETDKSCQKKRRLAGIWPALTPCRSPEVA